MRYAAETSCSRTFWQASLICLAIFLFGVGFGGAGVYLLLEERRFAASAARATGTVVDLERRRSGDRSVSFPVYEFTDQSGRSHRATSTWNSSSDTFYTGQQVNVLYDARNPDDSRLERREPYFLAYVFAGLGGLAVIVSTGAFVLAYRIYGPGRENDI